MASVASFVRGKASTKFRYLLLALLAVGRAVYASAAKVHRRA